MSVAASIAVLTACGGASGENKESSPPSQQQAPSAGAEDAGDQGQAPEPDLKDIPNVVATVNGKDVPKDKFVLAYKAQFQQAQMSGQELDQEQLKKQTADGLVGNELMLQEAEKRGLAAKDSDVDKKLDELMKQNEFKSTDELFAALKEQGLDKEQARAEVKSQISLEKLLADESGSMEPTDKELKDAYKQVVEQQKKAAEAPAEGAKSEGKKAEVPSFEEVKDQLAQQAKSQKQAEAAQALVAELKKDADVKILI
nr:SurA N-terminal domain-containing protein [Arthrobacter roseus]